MTRVFKSIFLGLLALLLLVALVLGLVLGTQAGSRWVLGQVPGVQVDDFAGHLGGAWQASQLRWSDGDNRVELLAPQLSWSPACLLRATLVSSGCKLSASTWPLPRARRRPIAAR